MARLANAGKIVIPEHNLLMLSGDASIAQGKEGAFYQMLERFSEYWQRVDILTPRAPGAKQRRLHQNVYVHPATVPKLLQPWFIRRKGGELLRTRRYHLLTSHDFGFFYNGIGAWLLKQRHHIPLVSEIHHVEGYPLASTLREKLWRIAAMRYLPFAARYVQAFRVVNQNEVPALLRSLGIPDEKILVRSSLYIDFDVYRPHPAVQKDIDVLFVARLAQNKGVGLLLDAFERLLLEDPQVVLAIRGDGPLRQRVEAFAAQYPRNMQMIPPVADEKAMATLYNRARILVCTSTVEGNPRVTVEAMACGVPVISTRVGIMPEIVEHGVNGLLIEHDADELADTIHTMLDNDTVRARMGAAGRQAVQRFRASDTIRAYAQVYRQIAQRYQDA